MKTVSEMRSEFSISCGRGQGSLWLQEVRITGSKWLWSQKRLNAWWCKDWHGLHESSYFYFKVSGAHCLLDVLLKVYAGTSNLKLFNCLMATQFTQNEESCIHKHSNTNSTW